MKTYCLSCKKFTANENFSVRKAKQNRLMILLKYGFRATKNQRLLKLKKSILLEIINLKWIKSYTFFLTGDIFMQELHLKESGFTYSACGPDF